MYNILLVGAGQLGSRHLQGLANSETALQIIVVEPDSNNQKVALNRFEEIANHSRHNITIYSDIPDISPTHIDLAIIATNSNIRAEVTKQVLERVSVNFLILEKVVFQSEAQFEQVIELLKCKGVKSWVNCPRRSYPAYHKLKNRLRGLHPIKLIVTGTEWGLACNAIHFIDLFSYLTDTLEMDTKISQLEDNVYPGKREGFIELYGSFQIQNSTGDILRIECQKGADSNSGISRDIKIECRNEILEVNEALGEIKIFDRDSGSLIQKNEFQIKFQSQLSDIQALQILETNESDLSSISESFCFHTILFDIIRAHYLKAFNQEIELIPIT